MPKPEGTALVRGLDAWQRRRRWAGVAYAVVKKSRDDNVNLLAVALAWYGFTSIFPLLLVVVTAFGFVGARSLGSDLVTTLHRFPVIGTSFDSPAVDCCRARFSARSPSPR